MDSRKFVALFGTAALAVTMVGAGISAQFTDQASARQDINVGSLSIVLDSSTPGSTGSSDGKSLTCPTQWVHASTENATPCVIIIRSNGTIPPSNVTLKASVESSSGLLENFYVGVQPLTGTWGGPLAGFYWAQSLALVTPGTVVGTTTDVPSSVEAQLYWNGLTNANFGQWVRVTYTVEATA